MSEQVKIRLETKGKGHAKWYDIFLDDINISRFVKSIKFNSGVDKITTIELELIGEVEFPDELKAIVIIKE